MMRRFLSALTLLGLLFPAVCKADPVDYSYSFSFSPNPPTLPGGTGSVTFSLFGGGAISTTTGTVTPLQAASLLTTSSATDVPDVFNSPYTLTVTVQDTVSGQAVDFGFDGLLGGTLTTTESTLTASFTGPLSVSHELGGFLYTVSVEPEIANLPTPGSLADVLLNANVLANVIQTNNPDPPDTDPPGSANAPEPGTLLLGVVAGAGVMLARRRRPVAK
jgi:hypothetical protein